MLILLREIITVHAEDNTKHINHSVGKMQSCFDGAADGTCRFHCVLKKSAGATAK
jgi:hypothetical protein